MRRQRSAQTALDSLASSIEAGLNPAVALRAYGGAATEAVANRLETGGETLAEALRAEGFLLAGPEEAVVRAGERTGDVAGALRHVAATLAAQRNELRSFGMAVAYPVFLILAASFILPFPTLVLHGLGPYLGEALPPLFLVLTPAALGCWGLLSGRISWATLLRPTRRLPGLAGIHDHAAAGRLCRISGRLLASGLPVDGALSLSASALPYPDQRAAVGRARDALSQGGSTLAQAFALSGLLPPESLSVVTAAERSGNLEGALAERAAHHEAGALRGVRVVAGVTSTLITLGVMFALATAILGSYLRLLPSMETFP